MCEQGEFICCGHHHHHHDDNDTDDDDHHLLLQRYRYSPPPLSDASGASAKDDSTPAGDDDVTFTHVARLLGDRGAFGFTIMPTDEPRTLRLTLTLRCGPRRLAPTPSLVTKL
jgi:hypothetical protein